MAQSTRKEDNRLVEVVNSYLDHVAYPQTTHLRFTTRVTDAAQQQAGSDLVVDIDGMKFTCDEKAAVKYIGKPLSTFSLELGFMDNHYHQQHKLGWLIDPKHTNDLFSFVWLPQATRADIQSPSDIIQCDIALVRKMDITNYLESLGWTAKALAKKEWCIRTGQGKTERGNFREHGLRFTISRFLHEQPVNVLLMKETYMEMAIGRYSIINGKLSYIFERDINSWAAFISPTKDGRVFSPPHYKLDLNKMAVSPSPLKGL